VIFKIFIKQSSEIGPDGLAAANGSNTQSRLIYEDSEQSIW